MKKILCCIICCACTGCAQINTLTTSAKNFLNRSQIQQNNELKAVNDQIEAEINRAYSGEYGEFVADLNHSIATPADVWNNYANSYLNHALKQAKNEQERAKIKNYAVAPYQKTNMLLNALFYEDLSMAKEALSTAQQNLLKSSGPCNNIYASELAWKVSNSTTHQRTWFCQHNAEYQKLVERLEAIKNVRKTIYSTSYTYEKNKFQKATGFDITNVKPLASTLLNAMATAPNKESFYDLQNIEVKQNVNGGILVGGNDVMFEGEIYTNKVAFIYTDRQYVDGRQLSGLVKYVGPYTYQSILGASRTIDAYEFFTFNWDTYNLKKNNFYFYPSTRKLKESDFNPEIVFGALFQKNK